MPHLREHISPSQIKTARQCMRKWAAEYCYGITQPETKAHVLGKQVHAILEEYATKGTVPDSSTLQGRIALTIMKFSPGPETPGLYVEQEILVPGEPKPFYGFIDYIVFDVVHEDHPGKVGIRVGDYKTTSDFKYALSEEQLRADPQALIYGMAGILAYNRKENRDPDFVLFEHDYGRTKSPASMTSQIVFTPDEVRQGIEGLREFAGQMLSWQNARLADIPGELSACGMYGGCHMRLECAKFGMHTLGDKPADQAMANLMASLPQRPEQALSTASSAAMDRLLQSVKTTQPREKKDMGFFSSVIAGEVAAKADEQPTLPALALAPSVEPLPADYEDDSINPPDGDAQGESQQLLIQTPAASVGAEDADEDVVETSTYVADVPQQAVATPEQPKQVKEPAPATEPEEGAAAKPSSTYGQGKALRDRVAKLFQQASAKPDVLHKLEVVAGSDQRVKWLLTGKTSSLRINDQWQALHDMLTAALAGTAPQAIVPTAAPPVATTVPVAVSQQADEVLSDPEVQAAVQAEQEAQAAQIRAKQNLFTAQERFKVLVQGDDEDAIVAFRSEVSAPAKLAVANADAAVVAAQTALADAKARALVRIGEAREAAARAASVQEQVAAQGAEQAQVAAAQALPRVHITDGVQSASPRGGIPTPALFIGAIPTRHAFVHLADFIMPYINRVQQEHKVSYYGVIRGDGINRIIEALLADVHSGAVDLPDIMVAHSVPMGLEGRALEALRPFFQSVFESVR